MRKTGRRFKEDSTSTIDKQEISIINTNESGTSGGSNKHEVCIGPDEPVKQKISLKEIGIDNNSTNSSMQSSRIFEKEFLQQKSKYVHNQNVLMSWSVSSKVFKCNSLQNYSFKMDLMI